MDNTPNINDIISNLTPDDINMLKDVASSILGEGAPENTQSTTQNFNNNQITTKITIKMHFNRLILSDLTVLILI